MKPVAADIILTVAEREETGQELVPARVVVDQWERNKRLAIEITLDSLVNSKTRKTYSGHLNLFFKWWDKSGRLPMSKSLIQSYRRHLQEDTDLAPGTINVRLASIRKMIRELADNGKIDHFLADAIGRVRSLKDKGVRVGNWLSVEEANKLLKKPDISTLIGLRDRAMLAIMLGTGLRESEMVLLTFEHLQQREGRWVILNIKGKGSKIRTIPMPQWTKDAIDAWTRAAGINENRVFRGMTRHGTIFKNRKSIITHTIWYVVKKHAKACGLGEVAPHDLRRTFAKLAYLGGAPIEQIQLSLGHESIETTMKYLGIDQTIAEGPCDYFVLSIQ